MTLVALKEVVGVNSGVSQFDECACHIDDIIWSAVSIEEAVILARLTFKQRSYAS